MLTGPEIEMQWRLGRIHIEPFRREQLNPNSYNLRIMPKVVEVVANVCTVNGEWILDLHKPQATIDVPRYEDSKGAYVILQPVALYLMTTEEEFGSDDYVACIDGRSSFARAGVTVHLSAGFGDLGFKKRWTLEVTVVVPNTKIYLSDVLCQGYFFEPVGRKGMLYGSRPTDKYADQTEPTPCRLSLEGKGESLLDQIRRECAEQGEIPEDVPMGGPPVWDEEPPYADDLETS